MRIGICAIVYVTNNKLLDLLKKYIESTKTTHWHKFYFYINKATPGCLDYLESLPNRSLITGPEVSVAEGWNKLIDRALHDGYDYVLVTNTDIEFLKDCINNLVTFAIQKPEAAMWSATVDDGDGLPFSDDFADGPNLCCFMVNQLTKDRTGLFDEGFERAYLEDISWHWKCRKLGYKGYRTYSAIIKHHASATIALDAEARKLSWIAKVKNWEYFAKKHGIDLRKIGLNAKLDPLWQKRGYDYPFDDLTKDWRHY